MILQTKRLLLREMGPSDFADLAEILQDPKVVYAYEHTFSDADVWEWLERQRRRYREDGFGLWAAVLKQTGEMIGQAGLTLQPCEGELVLEIGYLFKERHWHRGYAREAAQACEEYAFTQLHAQQVCSIIKADNEPSKRVAQSIGMKPVKTFTARYYHGDMLHILYRISHQEYQGGRDTFHPGEIVL